MRIGTRFIEYCLLPLLILLSNQGYSSNSQVEKYLSICDSLYQSGEFNKSLVYADKALTSEGLNDSLKAVAIFKFGEINFYLSNFDSAEYYLNKSLNFSKDFNFKQIEGLSALRLGNVYTRIGILDKAKEYLFYSDSILSFIEDEKNLAAVYNSLAIFYQDLGEPGKALRYHVKCLNYFKEKEDFQRMGVLYSNIGLLYYEVNDTVNALKNYLKSLEYAQKSKDQSQLSKTYTNLGNFFMTQQNYTKARYYFFESLMLADKMQNPYSMTNIRYNIGDFFLKTEEFDSAEIFLKESLRLSEENNIVEGIYYCNLGLGELQIEQGKYYQAILYIQKSNSLVSQLNISKLEMPSSKALFETFKKMNQYDSALKYMEIYHSIKDSLFTIEKEKEFKALDEEYQSKLKDEENAALIKINKKSVELLNIRNTLLIIIGLALILVIFLLINAIRLYQKYRLKNKLLEQNTDILNQKNLELRTLNENLEDSNDIKDKLLKVISHDMRSPINSLQGMLSLLNDGAINSSEFKKVGKSLESNILNFNRLSENILQWVKKQSNGMKIHEVPVDIKAVIKDTLELHKREIKIKRINARFESDGDCIAIADLGTINVVLRNLISNAIKFSPEYSDLTICVKHESEKMKISVANYGEKVADDILTNLKEKTSIRSTPGTNEERGLGMGLGLSADFLELNNSELNYSRKDDMNIFSFELAKTID